VTDTIFAGHHQPLKVWILCLYFMGLNLSNEQIAQELALNGSDVQQMTFPFAQSTLSLLNFKLPREMSTQPQPLQNGFLHC
jgi:hypothetical protein